MDILISIVIPTYKRSNMLDRAINSCLKQSYKNVEIIVVDDNNPNSEYRFNTKLQMEKYKNNKKIKYYEMPKNSGGAKARNFGIEKSKGKYVAFLDDDDYFLNGKLENQLNYMIDNKLDASFTGSETYDEDKKMIIKEKRYLNFDSYSNTLIFHLVEMIVSTQTFMFKRKSLIDVEGFSDVPAGQEYYLMYKIINKGFKVGYLDKILTRICIHTGERITTSKGKIEAEKFLYNLKKNHFDLLDFSQIRKVKYIYKYNIWQKYKSSGSFNQYFYLLWIIISHPILIIRKRMLK